MSNTALRYVLTFNKQKPSRSKYYLFEENFTLQILNHKRNRKLKRKMIKRLLYRYVFKRTSTFVLGIVVTSFMFERAYDHLCESIFQWVNDGRLWINIKHRYENPPVFPVVEETGSKQVSSDMQHVDIVEEISAEKKTD